jgi:hypothetical protein
MRDLKPPNWDTEAIIKFRNCWDWTLIQFPKDDRNFSVDLLIVPAYEKVVGAGSEWKKNT